MVWLEEERENAAAVERPDVESPDVDPLREVGYEECEQWEEVIEVMVEEELMRGLESNVGEGWGELREVLGRLVEREVEREVDGDLSLKSFLIFCIFDVDDDDVDEEEDILVVYGDAM